MSDLEYFFNIMSENADKTINKLNEINLKIDDILKNFLFVSRSKELKNLFKEFEILSITAAHEIKCMDILINIMEEEYNVSS